MAFLLLFKSLILSQLLLLLLVSAHDGKCPPSFECGYLGQISFPFTITQRQDCGVLAIHGCDLKDPTAPKTIQLSNTTTTTTRFPIVTSVDSKTITIADDVLRKNLLSKSCKTFNNYTLPPTSPLASFYIKYNITMFRCNHSLTLTIPKFYNYSNCSDYNIYYYIPLNTAKAPGFKLPSSLAPCSTIQLPVRDQSTSDPFDFLSPQVLIQVELSDDCHKCHRSQRGQCQLNNEGKFYCWKAVTATLVLLVGMLCYTRWKKQSSNRQRIDAFLKRHEPLPTRRYSYSEIKKATNSFGNKLGQGGFGSVYKGQSKDGLYVAVKVLTELKDDGEEFINEVASITKTCHVNIVILLGFCFEGSKRALVYEFMSNGSLEKFIFEENDQIADRQLDCKTLYHIAIGVAQGLEYLHKGCNTRILHFDIKPHNILLDENFSPKISDFGLAKICTRKESAVSIFGARGTAGYIAPEVFSRNFGAVSHKSDVYSYGMMVLEMVGRRKNINAQVDRSSEIYFPHWIYNRLESNQELGLRNIRNESDDEKMRKMTIVGLWCIQTDPSTRPAISKVVEMLEGSVELLQIPPKPFMSSPSTSPVHLSCETL
ncbi:LEAF RUST 10 DISEASE-RESISTANCE LOCUS RECEPTOR-LIKE PROTEIN KINASE-like 2.5 [Gastrolobium bilobum]|uniref:LEAF RUST 10 DISEASE-RESISTANCE LOCUS RECEPTOR-LIKE PROTEIN KINASE-like 2.5 n=1 Tax=Gastrolobium bilobum TaxID=150636 RepID=UPI002AB2E9C0|nr:LEAF RUST 10 DISEASE-RESISTANCE LOCUS RECEPTOR-LIKE PROTEIN KINASE-like 2.5 [Gastrolobium bilobum]